MLAPFNPTCVLSCSDPAPCFRLNRLSTLSVIWCVNVTSHGLIITKVTYKVTRHQTDPPATPHRIILPSHWALRCRSPFGSGGASSENAQIFNALGCFRLPGAVILTPCNAFWVCVVDGGSVWVSADCWEASRAFCEMMNL